MFEIGDVIVGNSDNPYSITCKGRVCVVVNICEDQENRHIIEVQVGKVPNAHDTWYQVQEQFFDLLYHEGGSVSLMNYLLD